MIGLVDGNNFYVSCERIFDPSLEGKAVAVLSNNDGCVISRSQECKDLGIPMGTPFFSTEAASGAIRPDPEVQQLRALRRHFPTGDRHARRVRAGGGAIFDR